MNNKNQISEYVIIAHMRDWKHVLNYSGTFEDMLNIVHNYKQDTKAKLDPWEHVRAIEVIDVKNVTLAADIRYRTSD